MAASARSSRRAASGSFQIPFRSVPIHCGQSEADAETRAKQQVRTAAEKRFMSAEETPDCGWRESAGAEGEVVIFLYPPGG